MKVLDISGGELSQMQEIHLNPNKKFGANATGNISH